MSGQCESGSCCDVEGGTSSRAGSCGSSGSECPCGTSGCSGDPIDCAQGLWSCSFFQALKETQVEILKGKIQKAWGPKMDKAAEAVLEAMGTQWQSMLAQAQAKTELRDRLKALWKEGK